jgi:hypothetical protein
VVPKYLEELDQNPSSQSTLSPLAAALGSNEIDLFKSLLQAGLSLDSIRELPWIEESCHRKKRCFR